MGRVYKFMGLWVDRGNAVNPYSLFGRSISTTAWFVREVLQGCKQTNIAMLYWDRPYSNPDFAPLEAVESTHVRGPLQAGRVWVRTRRKWQAKSQDLNKALIFGPFYQEKGQ